MPVLIRSNGKECMDLPDSHRQCLDMLMAARASLDSSN